MAQNRGFPNQAADRDAVPSFQLYGEAAKTGLPDLIHVETLRDRSKLHDWQIKPHRHTDLCQIMRFETPGVRIELDGRVQLTDAAALLFVPPRVVHGFGFTPQIVGTVTTIPVEAALNAGRELTLEATPVVIDARAAMFERLCRMLVDLEAEYRSAEAGRSGAITALVDLVLICVRRADPVGGAVGPAAAKSAAERRVGALRALIEQHYADGWDLATYARAIGISKSQLSRDCLGVAGQSPLEILHDRLVKEANRKLAYTAWPIAQISLTLGFADMGYFSRFYRARTGMTPSQYRQGVRSRAPLPGARS